MSGEGNQKRIRIAAVGDMHCSRHCDRNLTSFFEEIQCQADLAIFCGDITDYGLEEEAAIFARRFKEIVKIPALAVLGNHDFESGRQKEVEQILEQAGITVLDGEAYELLGIGFAGVKGFAGGFGSRELQPWGEEGIKRFVQESVDEALKLEAALSRLCSNEKIVILHYSPIEETVRGEPAEIHPFLGSSRLEEAINRYDVRAVFHGHAHFGSLEGKTLKGIPVYNVALPLLKRNGNPPFKLFTVEIKETEHAS